MIICLCQNISDRTIKALIERGVSTIKTMQSYCSIGRGCGKCTAVVNSLVEKQARFLSTKCCATSPCHNQKGDQHGERFREKRNNSIIK